jgi:hypothetical protein
VEKNNEAENVVNRAKIASLLTALQMRKLRLEQSFELERLLLKERDRSVQKGFGDLDKILGYYLERY